MLCKANPSLGTCYIHSTIFMKNERRPTHCPLAPKKEKATYRVEGEKYVVKVSGPAYLEEKQETTCKALVTPELLPGLPTKVDCTRCGTSLQIEPVDSIWS